VPRATGGRSGIRPATPQGGGESGYVMLTTLIMMSVFMAILAIAIDTASTRSRATELQRIADAAALAGASALPDLAAANSRAQEAAHRNDPSGRSTVSLSQVNNRPGSVVVRAFDSEVKTRFIRRTLAIERTAYAEQTVAIPMGTPYNSIGTGDLPGTIPGNPSAKQGYFLAINGPCTAKEDGDRFMSKYDGIRGSLAGTVTQNADAYHCADDGRPGHLWSQGGGPNYVGTPAAQWKLNVDYKPGGYSFIVNVPCDVGVSPCLAGVTSVADPVWIDVWDPWFLAWQGDPSCSAADRSTVSSAQCVVDKVPISNPDNNSSQVGLAVNFTVTNFAIYAEKPDGSFPITPNIAESFGSSDIKWAFDTSNPSGWPCRWDTNKWQNQRRSGVAFQTFCKDWFAINASPLTKAGRYRIQVAADPALAPLQVNASGTRWDGGRSTSMNTYSLRVRRSSDLPTTWTPCSSETSATCPTITGEGAMSVYVRTPGTSDLFLSKMAPANDYRGRTIQVQLWDPGEGASKIKILMPVHPSIDPAGWVSVPFTYSTSDPGLADFTSSTPVQDRAIGWTGGQRTPVTVSATTGLDVSGTYANLAPPWPLTERFSQFKFNGRLLTLDVQVPDAYGKDSTGATVADSAFQGGWWKIRYESGAGVEDRTTWVVTSGSGPVHLARPATS
jgi:Putative Flp pilus-assembly TadE/G-like